MDIGPGQMIIIGAVILLLLGKNQGGPRLS